MTNSANYTLQAHIPYDVPDHLFYGTFGELKAYVARHLGTSTYRLGSGKELKCTTVSGHLLADLTVYIDGPDIQDIIKEITHD